MSRWLVWAFAALSVFNLALAVFQAGRGDWSGFADEISDAINFGLIAFLGAHVNYLRSVIASSRVFR